MGVEGRRIIDLRQSCSSVRSRQRRQKHYSSWSISFKRYILLLCFPPWLVPPHSPHSVSDHTHLPAVRQGGSTGAVCGHLSFTLPIRQTPSSSLLPSSSSSFSCYVRNSGHFQLHLTEDWLFPTIGLVMCDCVEEDSLHAATWGSTRCLKGSGKTLSFLCLSLLLCNRSLRPIIALR